MGCHAGRDQVFAIVQASCYRRPHRRLARVLDWRLGQMPSGFRGDGREAPTRSLGQARPAHRKGVVRLRFEFRAGFGNTFLLGNFPVQWWRSEHEAWSFDHTYFHADKTHYRNPGCRHRWFRGTKETNQRSDCRTSPNAQPERNRWRRTCPEEATQDVCGGAGQNCRRSTEEMGGVQKAIRSGFASITRAEEAAPERGRTKGDYRSHETPLSGIPKDTDEVSDSDQSLPSCGIAGATIFSIIAICFPANSGGLRVSPAVPLALGLVPARSCRVH